MNDDTSSSMFIHYQLPPISDNAVCLFGSSSQEWMD